MNGTFFVDAHVHIGSPGWTAGALAAGIAAVRDAGMAPGHTRDRHAAGRPLLVSSCWALYKEGGYGSRFGIPLNTKSSIKTEIVRLKQAGADIIKTMASGMVSMKHPGAITRGGFDEQELRTIVEEAAFVGLNVMAHANGEQAIAAAARAGVRSIEHGFFMTEQALELLARNGIFWVPTTGALVRAGVSASPAARQFVSLQVQHHLRMVRVAHSLGVQLAVGTDCVLPDPGYQQAYEAEVSYFRQAGLTEDEVISIATESGARLLGIGSAVGVRTPVERSPGQGSE